MKKIIATIAYELFLMVIGVVFSLPVFAYLLGFELPCSTVYEFMAEFSPVLMIIMNIIGISLVVVTIINLLCLTVDREKTETEDEENDEWYVIFSSDKLQEKELEEAISKVVAELKQESFFKKLDDMTKELGIEYHGFVKSGDKSIKEVHKKLSTLIKSEDIPD